MAHRRRGMTLIELLVVLTILALLTTVAVTATDSLLGQGRYDATTRTLNELQTAVLGPCNATQPQNAALAGGFVADVGRLPMTAGSDGLAELYANPNNLAAFAVRPAPSDPEVLVPCGWRGPYVQLPVGGVEIRDGWGNRFDLLDAGGNPIATAGQSISSIRSRGADGLVGVPGSGGGPYDADPVLLLNRPALSVTVSGNVYLLDGSGNRSNPTDAGQVTVKMFGPQPGTGLVQESAATVTAGPTGVVSYSFAQPATAGPRFVRAYLGGQAKAYASGVVRFQQTDAISLDIRYP